jgi:hypothetical protein
MFTTLFIIFLICFIVWLVGACGVPLPGPLSTIALVGWVVLGTVLLVLALMGRGGVWWR